MLASRGLGRSHGRSIGQRHMASSVLQVDGGVACVLAEIAAGSELPRPPSADNEIMSSAFAGTGASAGSMGFPGRGDSPQAQVFASIGGFSDTLGSALSLTGAAAPEGACAGMAVPSGGVDAPDPPSRWAERTLGSSETILGCLQTAFLRLSSSAPWILADSDFVRVALPAVLSAGATQLEAAELRRQQLLIEAEGLREHAARKEEVLADLRQRIDSRSWFPRQEHLKVEGRYKVAKDIADALEAKLNVAKAELSHLQSTVGESVNAEREALHRRREEIAAMRDARQAEHKELRERLTDTEDKLSTLQTEAYAQSRAAQKAEAQASLLPETEKKLRELQTAMSQRQLQLQEARAKQKKKKGKGKKKAG